MEAQAAVAEEEDLFEVLQRRIEAQRSELREGRESIENVMKSEVSHPPLSELRRRNPASRSRRLKNPETLDHESQTLGRE